MFSSSAGICGRIAIQNKAFNFVEHTHLLVWVGIYTTEHWKFQEIINDVKEKEQRLY